MPLDPVASTALLDAVQQATDVDRDAQICLDQLCHDVLERVQVGKDGCSSRTISLVGDQFMNVHVVLEDVSLLAIADVDRMVF